ncbi:hypothetical protein ACKVV7_011366 [Pyricularia oryzae]
MRFSAITCSAIHLLALVINAGAVIDNVRGVAEEDPSVVAIVWRVWRRVTQSGKHLTHIKLRRRVSCRLGADATLYAGGAYAPYRSGSSSKNISPFLLVDAALAFWPFHYPQGAYFYPYRSPYHYHNTSSRQNETREVLCDCSQYEVCSCDNEDEKALPELISNGFMPILIRASL